MSDNEFQRGVEAERARVVAWLRSYNDVHPRGTLANRIESGEHESYANVDESVNRIPTPRGIVYMRLPMLKQYHRLIHMAANRVGIVTTAWCASRVLAAARRKLGLSET